MKSITLMPDIRTTAGLIALAALALWTPSARAQSYTDLHDFGGTITLSNGTLGPDGRNPGDGAADAGVTVDNAGDICGTTPFGGQYGYGMVWEITAASGFTDYVDLHDFGGSIVDASGLPGLDGEIPQAALTFDAAGNMYGSTWYGGPNSSVNDPYCGNVWELTAASGYTVYKDLHDFGGTTILADGQAGSDGTSPNQVAIDANGNLFGTTAGGGENGNINGLNCGMVWELTQAGEYLDLHDFGNVILSNGSNITDGYNSPGGVVFDPAGNMYGNASHGGANGDGMVWELTAASGYTVYNDLHDFGATNLPEPDGFLPWSPVAIDSAGNLYGTTLFGGANDTANAAGIVWEISNGVYRDIHDFGGTINFVPDGGEPQGPLAIDPAGDIYGTTQAGGQPISTEFGTTTDGVVYELRQDGTYYLIHNFGETITNADGVAGPDGSSATGIGFDSQWNLYGGTYSGGPNKPSGVTYGAGLAWKLVPPPLPPVAPVITPASGSYVDSVSVSIADPSPHSVVYYTTDGNAPVVGNADTLPYAGSFNVTTDTTVNAIGVVVGASSPSPVATATYTITAGSPAALLSITVTPHDVVGGTNATATVNLTSPAPAGGIVVSLSTDNAADSFTQPSVTIPAGATSTQASITSVPVGVNTVTSLIAKYNGVMHNTHLTVEAPSIAGLAIQPQKLPGGSSATGTVKLNGVTATDTVIDVTSSDGAATIAGQVVVPAGGTSTTFTIDTIPVAVDIPATITASYNNSMASLTMTVRAPALASLGFSPKLVVTGQHTTLTVTLATPAPAGGLVVPIAYVNGATLGNPTADIVVPAGSTTGSAVFDPGPVAAQTMVTASASEEGIGKSATLTINP